MQALKDWKFEESATEFAQKLLYMLNNQPNYDELWDIFSDVLIFAYVKYGMRRYRPSVLGFSCLYLGLIMLSYFRFANGLI